MLVGLDTARPMTQVWSALDGLLTNDRGPFMIDQQYGLVKLLILISVLDQDKYCYG